MKFPSSVVLKFLGIGCCFALLACSKKPEEPKAIAPAKFYAWQVPGQLADAQQAGFSCAQSPDKSIECVIKDAEICGAKIDARLSLYGGKPSSDYSAITLIARKPYYQLEDVCPEEDGIVLVDTNGREIKKKNNPNCVRDRRVVLDESLTGCGWKKVYRRTTYYYTHAEYPVEISHRPDDEVFIVTRSEGGAP